MGDEKLCIPLGIPFPCLNSLPGAQTELKLSTQQCPKTARKAPVRAELCTNHRGKRSQLRGLRTRPEFTQPMGQAGALGAEMPFSFLEAWYQQMCHVCRSEKRGGSQMKEKRKRIKIKIHRRPLDITWLNAFSQLKGRGASFLIKLSQLIADKPSRNKYSSNPTENRGLRGGSASPRERIRGAALPITSVGLALRCHGRSDGRRDLPSAARWGSGRIWHQEGATSHGPRCAQLCWQSPSCSQQSEPPGEAASRSSAPSCCLLRRSSQPARWLGTKPCGAAPLLNSLSADAAKPCSARRELSPSSGGDEDGDTGHRRGALCRLHLRRFSVPIRAQPRGCGTSPLPGTLGHMSHTTCSVALSACSPRWPRGGGDTGCDTLPAQQERSYRRNRRAFVLPWERRGPAEGPE